MSGFLGKIKHTVAEIFLGAFSCLLLMVPLTRDFHYEYGAIIALLLAPIGSLLAIRQFAEAGNSRGIILSPTLLRRSITFSLVPLVIGIIGGIIAGGCTVLEGVLFYLVLALPSMWIGIMIGCLAVLIFPARPRWFMLTAYLLLLIMPVVELYFADNVFFYHPLLGFFPGTIYDELVEITWRLVWYRVFTVIYFSSLPILIILFGNSRIAQKKYFLGWVLAGLLFWTSAPWTGFAANEYSLSAESRTKIDTPHFTIYCIGFQPDASRANVLALLHEGAYRHLTGFFKTGGPKITSFIFHSAEEKYRLIGAGTADLAKPWLAHIYITRDNLDASLVHELAHVFTAQFGYSPFKVSYHFNALLLEGAATAAMPGYDSYGLKYLAQLALTGSRDRDVIGELSAGGFFTSSSSYSYIVSGAFCRFLIEQYGIAKFKHIYQNGFQAGFSEKKLERIQRDFKNHLFAEQGKRNTAIARLYFNRETIFSKRCPRLVASRLREARRLMESGNSGQSLELLTNLSGYSDSPEIVFALSKVLRQMKRYNDAVAVLSRFNKEHSRSPYYFAALLRLGDVYALAGKTDSARYAYSTLRSLNLQNHLEAAAVNRLYLMERVGDIRSFLTGSDSASFAFITRNDSLSISYESLSAFVALGAKMKVGYPVIKEYIVSAINMNFQTTNITGYADAAWYALEHRDYDFCRDLAAEGIVHGNPETIPCLESIIALCDHTKRADEELGRQVSITNLR